MNSNTNSTLPSQVPSAPCGDTDGTALLPCPFCGAPGFLVGGVTVCEVKCTDTDCTARGREAITRSEAIAAWNRRVSPPALLAAGNALYAAIGDYKKPDQGFLTPEMIAAGVAWCAAATA